MLDKIREAKNNLEKNPDNLELIKNIFFLKSNFIDVIPKNIIANWKNRNFVFLFGFEYKKYLEKLLSYISEIEPIIKNNLQLEENKINAEINDYKNKINSYVKQYDNINTLKNNISLLKNEIGSYENLAQEFESLSKTKKILESTNVHELKLNVDNLSKAINELKEKIEPLKIENNHLKEEKRILSNELDLITSQISSNKDFLLKNKNDYESKQVENTNLENKISEFSEKINHQIEEAEKLKKQLSNYHSNSFEATKIIDELKKQLEYSEKIAKQLSEDNLDSKLNRIKDEFSNFEANISDIINKNDSIIEKLTKNPIRFPND